MYGIKHRRTKGKKYLEHIYPAFSIQMIKECLLKNQLPNKVCYVLPNDILNEMDIYVTVCNRHNTEH